MTFQYSRADQTVSLASRLISRSETHPDHLAIIHETERGPVAQLSYRALVLQASQIAAGLQRRGLQGQPVGLLYPAGAEFVCAFLGCLFAGAIAVPLATTGRRKHRVQNIANTLRDCGSPLTMMATVWTECNDSLATDLSAMGFALCATDALCLSDQHAAPHRPKESDIAVLQYTSGSTGHPKGVVITHGAMMANQRMIERAFGHDSHSDFVGWAPHYHDQGLFGNIVQPLYLGATCVLMTPNAFLRSPLFWLETISAYRATTSGGPNFAFDLCVAALAKADGSFTADLSSWRNAFNGAEPIRALSLTRFATAFETFGFRPDAFLPCYGMAECTLLASGSRNQPVGQLLRHVDAKALAHGKAVDATASELAVRTLVSCGKPVPQSEIRICDPADPTKRLPDRQVGEVLIAGPHICKGYWSKPGDSHLFFDADGCGNRFLRSGDLGFLCDGSLYVTGRCKDVIILSGRNIYPADVEESICGLDPNLSERCIAAFGYAGSDSECLGLAIETTRTGRARLDQGKARKLIRQAVTARFGLAPHRIVFVRPGGLPMTTSGKMMRSKVRRLFERGALDTIKEEEQT